MTDRLKLYYWPGACSLAPHIALEEARADYEPVLVAFDQNEQRSPAYLKINPKGRVPVLVRGNFVLTENPAILRCIAVTHPEARLWPDSVDDDVRCSEWLAWISSTVHVTFSHVTRPERYADGAEAQGAIREKGRESTRQLWKEVDGKVRCGQWAVGDQFSVVDPYVLVVWVWARDSKLFSSMEQDLPNWTDHARRMAQRLAVQRVFEREGLALPEG